MLCRFCARTLLAALATRNSQLPACGRCRLRACVSPTTTRARGTSALWCHGTDVGGGSDTRGVSCKTTALCAAHKAVKRAVKRCARCARCKNRWLLLAELSAKNRQAVSGVYMPLRGAGVARRCLLAAPAAKTWTPYPTRTVGCVWGGWGGPGVPVSQRGSALLKFALCSSGCPAFHSHIEPHLAVWTS
jgi:hypothetical protein